jgi:hypothetical protein
VTPHAPQEEARPPTPGRPDAPLACASLPRALATCERKATDPAPIRAHLAGCPACRDRHGARVRALEAFHALRERSLPAGAVDGLYEAVRARSALVPAGGGISPLFLDAPRALRAWRTVAVAAGVMLAVGVGWISFGGARATATRAGERVLEDARPVLLQHADDEGGTPGVTPAAWWQQTGRRGPDGFLVVPAAPVRKHEQPPRWN